MAITNYTELQAAVGNWLNRTDLSARIPEFIALAEAQLRRRLRDALHSSVAATNVSAPFQLPAGFESVTAVYTNDGAGGVNNHPLDLITGEDYHALLAQNSAVRAPVAAAFPDYDAVTGITALRFYPPVSVSSPIANLLVEGTLTLEALASAGSGTNPLLRDAPDVYLYAALLEAAPYLEHDERVPLWANRLAQGVHEYIAHVERRRFSGVPRRIRLPRVF